MATIPNTTAPNPNEYGGDEISSLVLDPGSWSIRAGFSGEDVPKSVVPSHYGRFTRAEQDENGNTTDTTQLVFGDDLHIWRKGLEIGNPIGSDGVVQDWDTAEKLFRYAFTSRLIRERSSKPTGTTGRTSPKKNGEPPAESNGEANDGAMDIDEQNEEEEEEDEGLLSDHPLLMTEPGNNPGKNREKSIEIAMESWSSPAFWLAKSGVLASFAAGKATALVIELGASSANVMAVHDGLALKKSIQQSPLAGNFVSDQIRLMLSKQEPPYSVTPFGWVTSKTAVEPGAPPNATVRTFAGAGPSASFRRYEEERVLKSMKEYTVQIWPNPGGSSKASPEDLTRLSLPPRPFEFPDGYNVQLGTERFKLAEGIFDPSAAWTDADHPEPEASKSLLAMIKSSLEQVDVDIRMQMLQNVVVTGSSSLLNGFTERLNLELTGMYPGARVRISAPGNPYERKYGPWIGGSILSSLGSFHQMWISKKEYDEFGPSIVEKRCK